MSRRRRRTASALALASLFGAALPATATAHGLVAREDLPLPEWLFAWGALVILIVSFGGLLLGWREPKLEDAHSRRLPGASNFLLSRPVAFLCGAIGVGLLVLVFATALTGTSIPDRNFSLTFVFVTFWVGLVIVSVLFGDVYRAFNPWRAIGRTASAGFTRLAGQEVAPPLSYPERLGRWPAAFGLFAFLFLELVWGYSGFAAAGITTRDLGIAVGVYSIYTFAAMGLFGVETWMKRGDAFAVYFEMFASLSPLGVKDGKIVARLPFSGSVDWSGPAGSLAIVVVAIAGTTFDGAQEGVLKNAVSSLYEAMLDVGLAQPEAYRLTNTLLLAATIAAVALIFWAGILGMRIVERTLTAGQLAKNFAHAFIPIAFAYILAHYFSYIFYLEQAQFTFLLSDPFGDGSDLLGTASGGVALDSISADAIWWVQFGAIVGGHVVALALGHDRALSIWGNTRDAAWSQGWMLVMMMMFSVGGLYLLSQSNG